MTVRWSKLKKRIESNFCEALKDRVTLYSTWYKKGGSPQRGRASVLLDKIEIYEANTDKWIMNRVHNERANDNVLIQGLAIIDKRLGKRRLINMNIIENHFVKKLYNLRCEIEGIRKGEFDEILNNCSRSGWYFLKLRKTNIRKEL